MQRPNWVNEIPYPNVDELIADLANEDQESRSKLRLLITGPSGAGKTTFINRYLVGFETTPAGHTATSETRDLIVTRLNLVDGIYEVIDLPGLGDNRTPDADEITSEVLGKLANIEIDFKIFLTHEHRLDWESFYGYQCAYPGFFDDNVIVLRTHVQSYIDGRTDLHLHNEQDIRRELDYEGAWATQINRWNTMPEYRRCPLPPILPPLILGDLDNEVLLDINGQPIYPWKDELIAYLQDHLPKEKADLLDWVADEVAPPLARETPANVLIAEIPLWR